MQKLYFGRMFEPEFGRMIANFEPEKKCIWSKQKRVLVE